jgi:uncharacterized protein (TIGR00645 family)
MKRRVEERFEGALFAARWLAAPIYFGLVLALGMLMLVFLKELIAFLPRSFEIDIHVAVFAALTFIDVSLVANLLLIVVLAGYENFVSRIDTRDHEDRPSWMGRIDFHGLKMKLFASIAAITAIELLKAFLSMERPHPPTPQMLGWMIAIHLTFVVTTIVSALTDWLLACARSRGH